MKKTSGFVAVVLMLLLASARAATNVYVRVDGSGNDGNLGTSWGSAFATLQKALLSVPDSPWDSDDAWTTIHGWELVSTQSMIHVQACTGTQAYAAASRSTGVFDARFEGGWVDVDGTPEQTGASVVTNAGGAGIATGNGGHGRWRRIAINRFVFTNVARGVEMINGSGTDDADLFLYVSNSTVRAKNDGLYIDYNRSYTNGYGGRSMLVADNVDIVAGLGGTPGSHGVTMRTPWMGSRISASGTNPATGDARVSMICSSNGCGIYMAGINGEPNDATFLRTIVYGCPSNGIQLTSAGPVRGTLNRCTVADNSGDGLLMLGGGSGSWAAPSNSIFSGNAGHGVSIGTNGQTSVSCMEGYNDFFNDDIQVSGAPQVPAGTDSTADPLFWMARSGPDHYMLRWTASPCYRSDSTGGNRGACQNSAPGKGLLVVFR